MENRLASDQCEYDAELTVSAGSYYDKMYVSMLLTESVDNFISDSRLDFLDGRYRAVSMADLFPDGYRRFLGNMLTGDDALKGARIAIQADGNAEADDDKFPLRAIGWTSWWGETPRSCFPGEGTTVCASFASAPPARAHSWPRPPASARTADSRPSLDSGPGRPESGPLAVSPDARPLASAPACRIVRSSAAPGRRAWGRGTEAVDSPGWQAPCRAGPACTPAREERSRRAPPLSPTWSTSASPEPPAAR